MMLLCLCYENLVNEEKYMDYGIPESESSVVVPWYRKKISEERQSQRQASLSVESA